MPDVFHDGSPGPSVKKPHAENQLVLHQDFPRRPYAQVARTGLTAKEFKLAGPSAIDYGVAKRPGYVRIAPKVREIDIGHQKPDHHRALHQGLESSILDEDHGKARNALWEKIRRYQNNLAFAPHGTLFPQTCAVSLEHHHVYGSNNGAGYPYEINEDGKLKGCLFCMPSIFHPELLIVVSNHYDSLPRPPEPRPIGYEVKQLQAERDLRLQGEKEAQQQMILFSERHADEFAGQYNKNQAVDNNSEKGKQRQITASNPPYSMHHGLPASVTQSLEPYIPATSYQHPGLALMALATEQSALVSHGGSPQTHAGPANTAGGPVQGQRDIPSTQRESPKSLLPLTLYSNDQNGGQSNAVQHAPGQVYGMDTQDTHEQKNPVRLDVPETPRPSFSKLHPDHPEFVPMSHRLLRPAVWSPKITFDETDPQQQAIRKAFENPVPRKQNQYATPQKRDPDGYHLPVRPEVDDLVLHVPVPRRHIAAGRVQHFEAGLEGFTPPRVQLPYGMEPPPLEEPERAALDARNQSASLENAYRFNRALQDVPSLPRNSQVFNQDTLAVRTPYHHKAMVDAYQPTHGQDSVVVQQLPGADEPMAVQKTYDEQDSNTQQAFSDHQSSGAQQSTNAQQSHMVPKVQLPKQIVPAPVRHRGLWLPHEHLDEIGSLPNLNARMVAAADEKWTYNQLVNGPPGRFPLSNIRSTAQHLNPNGPSQSSYHGADSSSSSANVFVSESSEGGIASWDHPGNTTSLSIFERRSASHVTQKAKTGNHHAKRKQRRPSRVNGSSGNHHVMNRQVSHGYEHQQQQFASRQCQIQSLQTQLTKLQQQQERAERQFFEQQQLISQNNIGTWGKLTTGQLVFVVKSPQIGQAQSNQGHYNQGHYNQDHYNQDHYNQDQFSQALVRQHHFGQTQTEDDDDISRL